MSTAVLIKRADPEEKKKPRCNFSFTYREDQKERGSIVWRAGDTETCGRASACPVCGQCRYGERSGHCPGHAGVLSYLLPEDQQKLAAVDANPDSDYSAT